MCDFLLTPSKLTKLCDLACCDPASQNAIQVTTERDNLFGIQLLFIKLLRRLCTCIGTPYDLPALLTGVLQTRNALNKYGVKVHLPDLRFCSRSQLSKQAGPRQE